MFLSLPRSAVPNDGFCDCRRRHPDPGARMTPTPAAPRCLLVCFNRLFPANQGNSRRIMQLVRFYKSQGFEVDLLYHNEEGFDVGLSDALAREFARITVLKSSAAS
jgi:hypothetical protein